eukprot:3090143-Amphidinium_carterae.1
MGASFYFQPLTTTFRKCSTNLASNQRTGPIVGGDDASVMALDNTEIQDELDVNDDNVPQASLQV